MGTRLLRKVLSFWLTPYRASTWRRFGYAVVAAPVSLVCVVLALTGYGGTAARYQRRLAGEPERHRYPARTGHVLACAVVGFGIGAVSWVLLNDLAFLMFINLAYPLRSYVSLTGHAANFLPWHGWNLLWNLHVHPASGPDPWADTYTTSWGGPTLIGAWAVHAGLSLLTIYPVLAWAIRGLHRLYRGLTGALLATPATRERVLVSR